MATKRKNTYWLEEAARIAIEATLRYAGSGNNTTTRTRHIKEVSRAEGGTIRSTQHFIKGPSLTDAQRNKFRDAYTAEYQYVGSFGISSGKGTAQDPSRQYVTNIQSLYSGNAVTAVMTPLAFQQSAGAAGLQPGSQTAEVDILIPHFEWTFEFTNMAPSCAFVTIYILRSRKDTGSSIITPQVLWETAVDQQAGSALASTISQNWPFQRAQGNKGFNEQWETVHTLECTMNPGEVRRHQINAQVNQVRSYAELSANQGWVKGMTYYAMLVARGTPADSANTNAIGTIQIAPCKIVGIYGVKQHCKVAMQQSKILAQFNSLPTVGTATQYTINDDSGAVVGLHTDANYG